MQRFYILEKYMNIFFFNAKVWCVKNKKNVFSMPFGYLGIEFALQKVDGFFENPMAF
jgi:hypothetical protein